ncbi:MAG: alpha/beta fold hydrolase, partial [Bdellovibrionaceae bacterium]|nr:alpha/beta fold hydrolase [Pseudobdellovibrionaceae bacterium]
MKIKRWVLLRGLTRSRFHWLGFDQYFKKRLQVESVDCPEVPGSGYLHQEKSLVNIDAVVIRLREQISRIEEPIGLLGVSMGGMLAARWAEMFPQEIAKLVIVNSSSDLSPSSERLLPRNYWPLFKSILTSSSEEKERFVMTSTSNEPAKWQQRLPELVAFSEEHPIRFSNFIAQLRMCGQVQFGKKPVKNILILSAEQDHFVSLEC